MEEDSPRVVRLGPDDVVWPFEGKPKYFTRPLSKVGAWPTGIDIDPTPAYAHDFQLVRINASEMEFKWPIDRLLSWYILDREVTTRTNGHASRHHIYEGTNRSEGMADWEAWIVFSGKRIPPMPAMTNYLCAHEYGHIVQWDIEHRSGMKDAVTTELDKQYMSLRPRSNNDYGAGRWHSNVGELFANDWRILVAGVEKDFWPHPGFPRPDQCEPVQRFWEKTVADFAKKPEPA